MSTAWDVYCTDCKSSAGLEEHNNHGMCETLCEQAAVVQRVCADLDALLNAFGNCYVDMNLYLNESATSGGYNRIRLAWWIEHGAHRLVPRNEYGRLLGEEE